MPIYEYRCESCGHEFERLTRSHETTAAPACPDCRGSDTRRIFSTFGMGAAGDDLPAASGGGCGCTPSTCGCRAH